MHRHSQIVGKRICLPPRRYISARAVPLPEASEEQIFRNSRKTRVGNSLGTEDEWNAAIRREEEQGAMGEDTEDEPLRNNAAMFASNRVGQVYLPKSLITTVNSLFEETHKPHIRSTLLRLYESLQAKVQGKGTSDTIPMPASKNFTSIEADAYLAGFMPQVYASVYTVLLELRKRLGKDWQPERILDCGLGPGTAGFAYRDVFVNSNPHPATPSAAITVVEPNDELRHRAETLWADEVNVTLSHAIARNKTYNVILAPHVLGDVKGRPSDRDTLVRNLWQHLAPGGVLLLLERGHPLGFEAVARAREVLLRDANHTASASRGSKEEGSGAHIIAPCPHDGKCPLYLHGHQPNRHQWCHFSQRLVRPDFLQRTKHGKDNYEDVGYSYILMQKGSRRPTLPLVSAAMSDRDIVSASYHWSRLIMPPLKRHKHVQLDVCSSPLPSLAITPHLLAAAAARGKSDKASLEQVSLDIEAEEQREEEEEEQEQGVPHDVLDADGADLDRPLLQRMTIPKSQGQVEYTFARKSHWGDLLPFRGKTVVLQNDRNQVVDRKPRKDKDGRTKRSHVL